MLDRRIQALTSRWTKQGPPAPEDFAQFRRRVRRVPLPADYLQFIRQANGASGLLSQYGPWLQFMSLEDVLLKTRVFVPRRGLVLFATLHSDHFLAFDTRARRPRILLTELFVPAVRKPLGATLAQALGRLAALARQSRKLARTENEPDIGWVPTPQRAVATMLRLAELQPSDLLYDLGCGDGRIVITAARQSGVRAVGYDIDPEQVRQARANVRQAGLADRVTIKRANIFTVDLRPASVITLYLLSTTNERLIPQLLRMRPGARIVSYTFSLGMFSPDRVVTVKDPGNKKEQKIYLWRTPLKEG